jgi:uncharacterized membrane protein YfcA
VVGAALGALAGFAVRRRPRPLVQWVLGLLVAIVVIVCWRLAWHA